MNAKWKPAVLAIACRWLGMLPSLFNAASASVCGIAGCCPLARSGTAFSNVPPKSGFAVALRYRVHHVVSIVSCFRFVSRRFCGTPVTWLGGKTGSAIEREEAGRDSGDAVRHDGEAGVGSH